LPGVSSATELAVAEVDAALAVEVLPEAAPVAEHWSALLPSAVFDVAAVLLSAVVGVGAVPLWCSMPMCAGQPESPAAGMSTSMGVGSGGPLTVAALVWPLGGKTKQGGRRPNREVRTFSVLLVEEFGPAAKTPAADALLAGCVPETAGAVSGAVGGAAAAAVLAAGAVVASCS
jgi:hypothetical protein